MKGLSCAPRCDTMKRSPPRRGGEKLQVSETGVRSAPRRASTRMKETYPLGTTLHEVGAHHNSSTVDASIPFQHRLLPSTDRLIPVLTRTLRWKPLAEAEDALASVFLAIADGLASGSLPDKVLESPARFSSWARTIAFRSTLRDSRGRHRLVSQSDLEFHADPNSTQPFRAAEFRLALETAVTNLARDGVRRDWVSVVLLYLMGSKPSDIAQLFGAKVETIRKRIARSRGVVEMELRRQFSLEVIS